MPTVLVPIADGSEDVETSTTTDVLVRCGVKVLPLSVMPHKDCVMARHLVFTLPDTLQNYIGHMHKGSVDDFTNSIDAVLLPGGLPGANHLRDSKILKEVLHAMESKKKLIGAICASPAVVLAHHHILKAGDTATCFPGMMEKLKEKNIKALDDTVVYCKERNILTSRGPGTSFAFALAAGAYVVGHQTALQVMASLLIHCENEINMMPKS